MVENIENNAAIAQVFTEEWVKELKDKHLFKGNPDQWKITEDNIVNVLRAISVNAAHYKTMIVIKIRKSPKKCISYWDMTQLFKNELTMAAQQEIKAFDDSHLFKTPAQKIITMLKEIQISFQALEIEDSKQENMVERINYAIEKIGQRTVFDLDYPLLDSLDFSTQRRPSVTKGWLNEFSQLGMECLRESSIRKSLYRQKQRDSVPSSEVMSMRSQDPSFSSVMEKINNNKNALVNITEVEFDVHASFKMIGRKNAMQVMTVHIVNQLNLFESMPQINAQIFTRFLNRI